MGEGLALDAAWVFAAFLVLLVIAAAVIAARRFLLERAGATIECGLRQGGGSWRLGVASYRLDEFCWFGVFGILMRPDETFSRRDLAVVSRRPPTEAEVSILGPGRIVVECRLGDAAAAGEDGRDGQRNEDRAVDLALAESALTGLLAWLEAAPPGSHLGVTL